MGIALLFVFSVLAFVTFFSSLMKTTASAVVISIMLLIIVMQIVYSIMQVTTTAEPVFLLNYYPALITSIFNMPDPRYADMTVPISDGESITLRQWFSPSVQSGIVGMLIYGIVLLTLAYLRFKQRQLSAQ